MKKEVIIAIIVGFSLGLVITFGVYRAQQSLEQKAAQTETASQDNRAATGENAVLLSLTQPEDGAIVDQESITIGGMTQKNALVTIISSFDDQAIQADELGNFSVEFELESGPNQIMITSFNQDGSKQEKSITVVYSTYNFEETETSEEDQT